MILLKMTFIPKWSPKFKKRKLQYLYHWIVRDKLIKLRVSCIEALKM